MRYPARTIGSTALAALLALGILGTASAAAPRAHSGASITPPPAIAQAGKLVFCSDVSYPPEEFFQGSTPVGSDVDIAAELARRMGVKSEVDNTGFDGIIAALLANKCDAIISGMNDTATRRKQVSFIDYLLVGQSIMVPKGNPAHIKTLNDLSGKTVGAEVGTTNLDFIKQLSAKLKKEGKAPINTVVFPKDSDGANALRLGKLDAYESDAPVVAYYIAKDPSSFEFGIPAIQPIPVGIAVRKQDNALRAAIQKGINAMYADGTMMRILKKWRLGLFALKKK
jgi:polar amino acid transport system substrate-binding protein